MNLALPACKRFGFDPERLMKGCIVGKAVLVCVKEYLTDEEYLKDSDKHLSSKEGLEEFGWTGKRSMDLFWKKWRGLRIQYPSKANWDFLK